MILGVMSRAGMEEVSLQAQTGHDQTDWGDWGTAPGNLGKSG